MSALFSFNFDRPAISSSRFDGTLQVVHLFASFLPKILLILVQEVIQVVLLGRRFAASDCFSFCFGFFFFSFSSFGRIPFKVWKIPTFFSMSSCSPCCCSSFFTGQARIFDITMSHTWIWVREAVLVLTFLFIYLLFCSFRFSRFARFVSLCRVLVLYALHTLTLFNRHRLICKHKGVLPLFDWNALPWKKKFLSDLV